MRAKRKRRSVTFVIQTETDRTGLIRGRLIGPHLAEVRVQDGTDRERLLRSLATFGKFFSDANGLAAEFVDGGDV